MAFEKNNIYNLWTREKKIHISYTWLQIFEVYSLFCNSIQKKCNTHLLVHLENKLRQIQMRLDKCFGSIMELLKDVLEEERRDSSCSNGCTTKMLTWLFVGHGLSVIGACPCLQNHMQYLSWRWHIQRFAKIEFRL